MFPDQEHPSDVEFWLKDGAMVVMRVGTFGPTVELAAEGAASLVVPCRTWLTEQRTSGLEARRRRRRVASRCRSSPAVCRAPPEQAVEHRACAVRERPTQGRAPCAWPGMSRVRHTFHILCQVVGIQQRGCHDRAAGEEPVPARGGHPSSAPRGREPQLARFPKVLRAAPEIPANVRLTGLRGVGKSVLLKEYEDIARREGWAVVRHQVEPRHNSEESVSAFVAQSVAAAMARMSRARRVKSGVSTAVEAVSGRLLSVQYDDITLSLGGSKDLDLDVSRNLYDAVEAALDTGHEGFALLLDEAQVIRDDTLRDGQHPLSMLVAAVNALQEAGLPLALVMCGLPTLRANLQRARTYAERMFPARSLPNSPGTPVPRVTRSSSH